MQFIKNTRKDKLFSVGLILKVLIAVVIIIFGFIFVNHVNLPAPIKKIEKILPNENFKKIK